MLFLQGRNEAQYNHSHRTAEELRCSHQKRALPEQCGEVVLSADTVEKIEHILQTVEKAVAEITVVNYPDCAA